MVCSITLKHPSVIVFAWNLVIISSSMSLDNDCFSLLLWLRYHLTTYEVSYDPNLLAEVSIVNFQSIIKLQVWGIMSNCMANCFFLAQVCKSGFKVYSKEFEHCCAKKFKVWTKLGESKLLLKTSGRSLRWAQDRFFGHNNYPTLVIASR